MENTILVITIILTSVLIWLAIGAATAGLHKRIFKKEKVGKFDKSDDGLTISLGPISFIIFLIYSLGVMFWSSIKWIAKGFQNFKWETLD
jgi:hypothetical protein